MLLMSEQRLDGVRQRCRSRTFEPAYRRLHEDVEAYLKVPLAPPDAPAGFYHNYFCPDHAVELAFDPSRPTEHRCPVDGAVFSGEPYDAAWRWFVNNRLSTMALKLGLLWRLEGRDDCLGRLRDILEGYAQQYPGFPPGPEASYGRGKATFQSLDEAVWLIPLVRGYDLIRESLSPAAQLAIEKDLLRPAAEHILGQKYYRLHNIECWHNAAIGAVGLCLGDAGLVRIAREDEFGFHHQLAEGVRDDGLWWEGSSSYHFYALAALMAHAQISEGAGHPLSASERLREMFRAPVDLAYPDLRLPATNDCWFFSSLLGDVCHGVPPAAAFYEVAYGWYGDPTFAQVLNANYSRSPRASLEALFYGRELPRAEVAPPLHDPDFGPSGFALLRSGDVPEKRTSLLLKYGPHGGSHGHPDKLGISFYVLGHPVSPDLGTPGYGIALNDSWYRQTLCHNTVAIDGRSQPPAEGRLLAFDSGAGKDFGIADTEVSWAEAPYKGVAMRRTVLWTDGYFLDLFRVACSGERQIDWVCRFRGDWRGADGLTGSGPVRLEGDGYGQVAGCIGGAPDGPVRLQWGLPEGDLAVFLPQEGRTEVIRGRVPFNPASETSDILIRRRTTRRTAFVTLIHHWEREPAVTEVAPVEGDLPEGVFGLRVHTGKGRDLWVVYEGEQEGTFSVATSDADRVLTCRLGNGDA